MNADSNMRARVLVIDDDAPMTRMIAMTLRSSGYDVVTATNGRAGLDQVATQHPDVILLDLTMPVMDGREFYHQLRTAGDATPVIILSAYGAREAQRELQADASMAKPFRPDDLAEKIEGVLRQ